MSTACSSKKADDQSAQTVAQTAEMEARIAELEAQLATRTTGETEEAETEDTSRVQRGGRERSGNREGTAAEVPQQDLQSIVNSIRAGGAGDPIPAELASTISWVGQGDQNGFLIGKDGSGILFGKPCRWIVKGDLLALSIPNYEYTVGGAETYVIDYFNHAFWEVKDGLLYLTANEYTNTYVEDLFFIMISKSPFMPSGK